jgi:elongator complex protein 2
MDAFGQSSQFILNVYVHPDPKTAQFVYCATLSGHEDWIRSLAFLQPKSQTDPLVLASGSQDGTIRLWNIGPFVKLVPKTAGSQDLLGDDLLDAFEASIGDLADAEEGGRQISLKQHILTVASDAGK